MADRLDSVPAPHDARGEAIVGTMEARYGQVQRIWVMDRGMTSAENLAWLRETEWRSLVGTPKGELRKWTRQIADTQDWQTVRGDFRISASLGSPLAARSRVGREPANGARRVATDQRVTQHIHRDDRSGRHDATLVDRHAGKDRCSRANPDAVLDGHGPGVTPAAAVRRIAHVVTLGDDYDMV